MIDMLRPRTATDYNDPSTDKRSARARPIELDVQRAKALLLSQPSSHPGRSDKLDLLRNAVRNHAPLCLSAAILSGLLFANKTIVLRTVTISVVTRLALSAVRAKLKRII